MKKILCSTMFLLGMLWCISSGYALTTGTIYTVEIDAIGSNGAVVDLAGLSATATADADGKISFSIANIPTNSSYNFLLVTVKNPDASTARRALIPAPGTGETLNFGVSNVTDDQTDAMLAALAAAGTDDPILIAFGMTVIRAANMTSGQLTSMANVCKEAVLGAGGFVGQLQTQGVTAGQLTAFRAAIVGRLDEFSSLYKDSVNAANATAAAQNRGKASGLLMNILVSSATTAGFPEDWVEIAMQAAGEVAGPLMAGAGLGAIEQAIGAEMGSGIQKMRAEKALKKYTTALTALGASNTQVTRYNTAANTLFASMETAFQAFEELFSDPTAVPDAGAITAKQNAINTAMQTAFTQFMTDAASTGAEIDDMATAMKNGLCGGNAGCIASINSMRGTGVNDCMFTFRDQSGNASYWPITMAVPMTWASNVVGAGGSLAYTRDTLAVPAMMNWLDSDDNPGNGQNAKRHDWGDVGPAGPQNDAGNEAGANDVAGDDKSMPATLAALFGLREDVQIIEFTKFAAFNAIGGQPTMAQQKTIMNSFITRLIAREAVIGGTTDGAAAISAAQKKALVITSLSPDFD